MVLQALQKVFRKPSYLILALVASGAMFAFAMWLPNIRLIASVLGLPGVPLARKLALPLSLLGSIATNFTLLSAAYTIAVAILFGLNLAMVVYFLKRRVAEVRASGMAIGFLGVANGVVGIGCATCGSFLLTSALSLVGAAGAIALLPLKGGEFGILSVILLAISLLLISKKIALPLACTTNNAKPL